MQELQKYYTFTRPHEVEEYRNQDILVETTLPSFVTEAFGHDNEAEPKDDVYRPRFVDMINPSTYVDTAPIEYGREEMIKFQRTTTDLESESITEANFHHHPEPSQPTKIYISDSSPVLLPPMRVSPSGYQPDDFDPNKLQATTISIFDSNLAYAKSLQKLYKTYKPSNTSTVKVGIPKKLVQNVPFKSKRRHLVKNPWQKDALPDFNYQVRVSKHEPEAQKALYPRKVIEERKHGCQIEKVAKTMPKRGIFG
uniref:Uncharacterized protein n=1 Tax=Acrobeloides nanus TaxID=290746 RepID=A0A914DHJ6_9BILA